MQKKIPKLIDILKAGLGERVGRKADVKPAEAAPQDKAVGDLPVAEKTKKRSAMVIQRAFRRHQFRKQMDQRPYETAVDLYSDPKDRTLTHYMFGKTNAIYGKKGELLFLPINPYVGQEVTSEIGYYRTDPISSMESLTDIVKVYDPNPDHNLYNYIPITLSAVLSVEDIIDAYAPKYRDKIKILYHPEKNTLLAFIKIRKSDEKFFQIKKILVTLGIYHGSFFSTLASVGIKASHWLVALQRPLLESEPKSDPASAHYRNLPKTVKEFKASPMVLKLRRLANKEDLPTKHLASTLLQLIESIKDTDSVNEEALKRMTIFVDLAVNLYEKNYDRFAFILYYFIHELTLLLNKKEISVDYKEFLQKAKNSTAKIFGLPENHDNLRYIAFPANSGTNALMLALNIAKKANGSKSCIRTEGPLYFEFDRLHLAQVTTDEADHDIYLITGGPTVWLGIYPGLDLNKVIRERVKRGQAAGKIKPMTLIVDATSGMHRNLKIDDDLKPYVLDGTISIIVDESHQKFGLSHSDQVQYGYVFGVCSNKVYDQALLDSFEDAAEKDLQQNIDMQTGAYLTMYAEEPLERTKEAHFANGALLRRLLSEMGLTEENMLPETNSLDDPERGLFVYVKSSSRVAKVIRKHFLKRDSFGHFNTTWCECGPFTRLTVSASDKVDVYIEASEIYFASFYSKEKMVAELSTLVTEQMVRENAENLSTADQVRLIGLVQTLMHLNHKPKNLIEQLEWNLAIKYMRERCPDLVGRKSYQAILEYQEQQFQQLKLGPYSFAEVVIHKVVRKDFSSERAAILQSLLIEYKTAEKSKRGRKQLPALQIAIALCGCTTLKVDIQKAKEVLLKNDEFGKAIIALDKLKLLKDLYSMLANGDLATERYNAIHCLGNLIHSNSDESTEEEKQEKRKKYKEIISHMVHEDSGDFAKAVILLHDSQLLLSKIQNRMNGFEATEQEKEKLLLLQNSLKEFIDMLEKDIYQSRVPTIEQSKCDEMKNNFETYILFANESYSNIPKIIATALHDFIQKVLHLAKPSAPSRVQVREDAQGIVSKFSMFSQGSTAASESKDVEGPIAAAAPIQTQVPVSLQPISPSLVVSPSGVAAALPTQKKKVHPQKKKVHHFNPDTLPEIKWQP